MDWRPYGPCCHRHAADAEIGFCPDCGHPFLRCMAFAECKSLVTPTDPCPICVAPALMIDAGAVVQARTGERMSVPLILRNGSAVARPLWVKRIMLWDGHVDTPLALTWEQIDAGAERRFSIDTPPMAEGGTYTLRVILVLASRYKGLEEEYAFAGGMTVTVSTGTEAKQIVQNITVSGTGGFVENRVAGDTAGTGPSGLKDRTLVPLERAEKYELEQGIRGYRDEATRVPRHVEFAFAGFRAADRPADGVTMLARGRLICGRNSRTADPASQEVASDVSLRAYDVRTGGLDEPVTMAISRHHFDLVVVNDRLCLQARTTRGLQLNSENLSAGEVAVIEPGDRIVPIPGRPDKLTLQVSFASSIGTVERILLSRTPAVTT